MKRKIFIMIIFACVAVLLLCGCANRELDPGTLDVMLDSKGGNLTITVAPKSDLIETYKGKKLYFFALDTGKSKCDLTKETPIASKNSGSTVSVSVPLNENGISRLYYGFTAAFYDSATNKYVEAVSEPAYVSNPEVLSDNSTELQKSVSIKGLCAEYDTDAIELGISHVIIDIPLDRYILPVGKMNAVSYIYNSKSYYIDRAELEKLDGRIKYYTDNGVRVYLRFKLEKSHAELEGELKNIAYAATVEGAAEYAINLNNTVGAEYVAGFFDFISERYTREDRQYGLVSSFIAGNALNTPSSGAAGVSPEDYISGCSTLVRIMHIALTSHYENGRVYLSIDHNWKVSAGSSCDTSGYKFISSFDEKTKLGGDFAWGVAATVKAVSSPDRVWYEGSGGGSYLTPESIGNLSNDLMMQTDKFYDGKIRDIIIANFDAVLTDSEKNQAASYAYAYYKAIADGNVSAFFYSTQFDKTQDEKVGLRTAGLENQPGNTRQIYEMLRDIDTDTDINAKVSPIIADARWNNLYSEYAKAVQVRKSCTGNSYAVDATTYDTSVLCDFSDGTLNSFSTVGLDSFAGLTRKNGVTVLEATLYRTTPASLSYISRKNLHAADFKGDNLLITLDVQSIGMLSGAYNITVMLVQDSDNANDRIVYAATSPAVTAGKKTTLAFDISRFRSLAENRELELRISASSTDGTDCKLTLIEILTGKERTNTALIVILIILASVAVVAIVLLIVIWFKKNYRIEFSSKKNNGKDPKKKAPQKLQVQQKPEEDKPKQ